MQQEKKYNPAACDHKLPNGLGSWMFHSKSSGSGPDMYHDVHVSVCIMCGTIRIGGFRSDNEGKLNRFNEEFNIHAADAIDAMIKYANYIHEEKVWGRLTERPAGAEWVKATERLPETIKPTKLIIVKRYEGLPDVFSVRAMTPAQLADIVKFDLANFEWLDESGQSKESIAAHPIELYQQHKESKEGNREREVAFAEWLIDEGWKPRITHEWARYVTLYSDVSVKTTAELWNEWNNQQKKIDAIQENNATKV